MNILMIISTPIPISEGIGSHAFGLAKRLRTRGHTITFMTRGYFHRRSEFEYDGFRVIKVPFYPIYPFYVYFHAFFLLKAINSLEPQPDVIHLHSPLVPFVPKKWPIVTAFHTPMLVDTAQIENNGVRAALTKIAGKTTSFWIEKKLLRISDAIITVSKGVTDELRTYYGYKDDIYLIPNIVDINYYTPSSNFKKRKLLYVGRLGYRKGLFELVSSAEKVVKEFPDVKYVIVGSGPLEKELKEKVARIDIDQNFEFCGRTADKDTILQHYNEAYAVLIPSYYEASSMTLLEAMSCGKAIISTTASFTRGILNDGINALLVKPRSVEELTRATIRILSSKTLHKTLGQSARKMATGMMDPKDNTDRVEQVYKQATEVFNTRKMFGRVEYPG